MTEATGWRWVPPDYTPEMYEAFRKARPKNAVKTEDNGWKAPDVDWFRAQYHALLAAAPSVPEPSEDAVERAARTMWVADNLHRYGVEEAGWQWAEFPGQETYTRRARAALSASAPEGGEPVAWRHRILNPFTREWGCWMASNEPVETNEFIECEPLFAAPPAAPADEQMAVLECYVAELDRAGIPDGCPIGTCPEQPARRSGILNAGHLRALARYRAQPADCTAEEMKERAAVDMENWPAPRKKTRYCKCGKPVVCVTIAAAAVRNLSTRKE